MPSRPWCPPSLGEFLSSSVLPAQATRAPEPLACVCHYDPNTCRTLDKPPYIYPLALGLCGSLLWSCPLPAGLLGCGHQLVWAVALKVLVGSSLLPPIPRPHPEDRHPRRPGATQWIKRRLLGGTGVRVVSM